jgi:hypothetical protein
MHLTCTSAYFSMYSHAAMDVTRCIAGGLQEVAVSKVAQTRDNVVVAIETFVHPGSDLCDQITDSRPQLPVVACQIRA